MCARLSPWCPEPAWAWVAVAVLRAVRGRSLRLHPHTHSTRACAHGHTRAHTDTTTHATCTCTHVRAHGHTSTHVRTCACAHTDTQAHTGTCPHTRAHFLAAPRAMCCHTLTQPRSHSLTHLNAPIHRDTLAHTHARSHQTPREQLPGPSPAAPGPGGWQAAQLPAHSRRWGLAGKGHQPLPGRLARFFRWLPDSVPWTLPTDRQQAPSLRGPLPGVSDPLAATQSWPWRRGGDSWWGRVSFWGNDNVLELGGAGVVTTRMCRVPPNHTLPSGSSYVACVLPEKTASSDSERAGRCYRGLDSRTVHSIRGPKARKRKALSAMGTSNINSRAPVPLGRLDRTSRPSARLRARREGPRVSSSQPHPNEETKAHALKPAC